MRSRLLRPGLHGAVVAGLAVVLTACGLPEAITEGDPEELQRDAPRQPPTELHPGLRDCAPAGSDDELSLADADLNGVSWSTPEGFYDVTGNYFEDNPVEDLQWMWVGASEDLPAHTLDVISVNHYSGVAWNEYADNCEAVPLDAVEEKLAQYRVHIGAEELSAPQMVEINGYPAMTQDIRLDTYDYEGYWLFSTDELLHVYCQWESADAEATIRRGCKQLVDSVTVP